MILVLTQTIRPDRLHQFYKDNPSLSSAEPFYSLQEKDGKELAPFQSFCLSQKAMLQYFLDHSTDEILCAYEDDCVLRKELVGWAVSPMAMLYLGCNLRGVRPEMNGNYGRIKHGAYMTHAIVYHRSTVKFIVDSYWPEASWQMYDVWLSEHTEEIHQYVLNPMIAYQRPCFSDLWGQQTDYTYTIDSGNELMNS